MKRLVLFGVVILFIIIGGFLIVDKVWLHKVFKVAVAKPGSCLVLEEKNCKKIKIIEKDGYKMAVATLPKGSVLFSPVSGTYNNTLTIHDENEIDIKKWDYATNIGIINSDKILTEYFFTYSKLNEINNKNTIEKGKKFGTVNNTKLKSFNDYNFVFTIYQESLDISNNLLLKMFTNK